MRPGRQTVSVRVQQAALPALLLTVLVMVLSSCGLPRRYYAAEQESVRDLSVPDRYLKRMAISPFEDRSGKAPGRLTATFEGALSAALGRNCGKVSIVAASDPGAPAFLSAPPRREDDRTDIFALTRQAGQMGFQVLVQGRILSLRHRVDRSGWSRWRESRHRIELRLQAEAFDAVTAAKIGQTARLISLPVDEEEAAAFDTGGAAETVALPALAEAIEEAGIDLALKLCTPIRNHPWQTLVKALRDDGALLAADDNAGLKAGDRLAVFPGDRMVEGAGGEQFVLPGFRRGTARVTAVTAAGALVSGDDGIELPVGAILVPLR